MRQQSAHVIREQDCRARLLAGAPPRLPVCSPGLSRHCARPHISPGEHRRARWAAESKKRRDARTEGQDGAVAFDAAVARNVRMHRASRDHRLVRCLLRARLLPLAARHERGALQGERSRSSSHQKLFREGVNSGTAGRPAKGKGNEPQQSPPPRGRCVNNGRVRVERCLRTAGSSRRLSW